MVTRKLEHELHELAQKMPILTISGPRQSGKTTLVKTAFPDYNYVNLEDPEKRLFAQQDPKGFLATYGLNLIIDEIQHVPELFSYLQVIVDEQPAPGLFVITGSQNFLLLNKVSQSLAGRTAILHLLPFSLAELKATKYAAESYEQYIMTGFYPRIYDKNLLPAQWLSAYTFTYVERDVRQIINIGDLATFQAFLKSCAGRIGQVLNYTSLGNDLSVSYQTIKRWISLLEASYIIFQMPPYYKNINKRIIKSPKLYFYDTGLASYLLGIRTVEQLNSHYLKGALFENLVIGDLKKQFYNNGLEPQLYFWREKNGHEIDCLVESGLNLIALEIKSGKTIHDNFFKGLRYWQNITGNDADHCFLIYGGDEIQTRRSAQVYGWNQLNLVKVES